MVDDKYKLISADKGKSFELYDLIEDEAEKENIIQNYPEIAMKMKVDLNDWLHSVENSKNGGDYK